MSSEAVERNSAARRPLRWISFGRAVLHLAGLWALALVQPLFGLLGDNAQFFVARGNTRFDILFFALGYALVPPLIGAALVWGAGRIRRVFGWGLHLAFISLLVAALVLPPLGDVFGGSAVALPIALIVGAAGGVLYARASGVRSFLTVLSPAPLLALVLFLLVSPVSELVLPGDASGSVAGPSRSSTPIVQIILDELPESTLAGTDGRIDATLFPNLAKLAHGATWYRDATTVADSTTEAVPVQLTGKRPEKDELPTAHDHPQNLFTLFSRSHRMFVVEPVTDLCPARLCAESRLPARTRIRALAGDLRVVAEHLLLPDDMRKDLPAINRTWEGFNAGTAASTGAASSPGQPSQQEQDVVARVAADDSAADFQKAAAALDRPSKRPPMIFVHSTLPHAPWRFLPDGRAYAPHRNAFPGLGKGDVWTRRQWLADQNFQRHVLQTQRSDALVGQLLDKLRAAGLYDKAVVVVTADHGVSFRAGRPRRGVSEKNMSDIANVPFIVKWPGQRAGKVDLRAVRTVDVLPTIAKAAGARIPWKTDGVPADERKVDLGTRVDVTHAGHQYTVTQPLATILKARSRREQVETALLRHGVYGIGPRPELIGKPIGAGARAAAAGPRAGIDSPGDFGAVVQGNAVVPAYVSGEVKGLAEGAEVAVAVNGRIEATTRVYREGEQTVYSAMVPPSTLHAGANAAAILSVLPGDRLRLIGGTARPQPYRLVRSATGEVIVHGRDRNRVNPRALTGFLDDAQLHDGILSVRGWAAPADLSRGAETVVAFANGKPLQSLAPTMIREDLAAWKPALRATGFQLTIPSLAIKAGALRVFGIDGGRATELKRTGNVSRVLDTAPRP